MRPTVVIVDDHNGFRRMVRRMLEEDGFRVVPPVVVLTSSRSASDYGSHLGRSPAQGFVAKAELSGPALAELFRAAR